MIGVVLIVLGILLFLAGYAAIGLALLLLGTVLFVLANA